MLNITRFPGINSVAEQFKKDHSGVTDISLSEPSKNYFDYMGQSTESSYRSLLFDPVLPLSSIPNMLNVKKPKYFLCANGTFDLLGEGFSPVWTEYSLEMQVINLVSVTKDSFTAKEKLSWLLFAKQTLPLKRGGYINIFACPNNSMDIDSLLWISGAAKNPFVSSMIGDKDLVSRDMPPEILCGRNGQTPWSPAAENLKNQYINSLLVHKDFLEKGLELLPSLPHSSPTKEHVDQFVNWQRGLTVDKINKSLNACHRFWEYLAERDGLTYVSPLPPKK